MNELLKGAPSTNIVQILKKFGSSPIPVDFLAESLGGKRPELNEYLDDLEHKGVVKREGDTIRLVKTP
jgi:DNA-binding IclR family transcriptional regulator